MKQKVLNHYKKYSWYIVELEYGLILRTCQEDEYNRVVNDGFLNTNKCLYWCIF